MIAKRWFDVATSFAALIVLSPLILLLALFVRIMDGPPVIFRQLRMGRHGQPFTMYKFRSMRAETAGAAPGIAQPGDPRVSRLGRILRRTKLDELPQLYNVLKGDMSVVGPRPELPEFVLHWPERDRVEILSLRPGLTDPVLLELTDEAGQLAGAVNIDRAYIEQLVPRKLAGYRAYVATRSMAGDLVIILRTLRMVVRGH